MGFAGVTWFVIGVGIVVASLPVFGANEVDNHCSPPIAGCVCNKGSLICRGKDVKSFPDVSTQSTNITTFAFTECWFDDIVDVPYPWATQLFVDKCYVKSIAEGALEKLTQLTDLSLSGNRLHNLSRNTFANLTSLTSLDLAYNQLTALPDGVFDGLPNLKTLDLSHNNVEFADNLFGASNVSALTCMSCGLRAIPKNSLGKLTNLKELTLNGNNLSALPNDAFTSMGSLEKLHLDNCQITSVSELAFWDLSALTLLDLGNNQLQELPQRALQTCWMTLKRLYLEANGFRSLREDSAPWERMAEVKLGGNPWTCDCTLAWMHAVHLRNIDKENVTCSGPEDLKGKNLFNVEATMLCFSTQSRAGIVLGIAIPVIVICLALIGYYVYQITQNRRRQARDRHSFKYRSVYGETVESNSKQSILT